MRYALRLAAALSKTVNITVIREMIIKYNANIFKINSPLDVIFMKDKINSVSIIVLLFLVIAVAYNAMHPKTDDSAIPASKVTEATADEETSADTEMRGMWVSYISLSMQNEALKSKGTFERKFIEIAETAVNLKCNALFVHVRPFCDALYKSDIFPYSHILTGEQGKDPGYDPLEIMTEIAQEYKLELHAWINPYRIKTQSSPTVLSENHPYNLSKNIGIEYDGCLYLNPASEEARKLITDGVIEIIENYKVDGIHFDDYFYPTTDESFDANDYESYVNALAPDKNPLDQKEWRKENVNLLISEVYSKIKSYDENITFGISPQGNIENDMQMGADVKTWAEVEGYVDYLCPQLYYSLENPALTFETGLENWLDFNLHKNLKLYAGLALYKADTDEDEGTWQNQNDILKKELELVRSKHLKGFIIYDYEATKADTSQAELKALKSSI